MAGLRQDEIRDKVQAYFKAQLVQYLEWLDRRGLSQSARDSAREEILDHDSWIEIEGDYQKWLPVQRFKRKMEVSDTEWNDSMPRIVLELRKGRRDMLRRVLETAERLDNYSYSNVSATPVAPSQLASKTLGQAIEDFMEEHSRQWPQKTKKQIQAYLNILLEYFGPEHPISSISKQDASEIKKILQILPASRNVKPALKKLSLTEVIKIKEQKTISPKTINSHIDTFRRLFDWAERHGHAPHKLFEGMHVPKLFVVRVFETDHDLI
ncbi:MAG: hypothetical protein JKX93_14610 [Rhizobiaceae bacterium]|nr:hypothetical protein [Rhizobiaceae bacterium]